MNLFVQILVWILITACLGCAVGVVFIKGLRKSILFLWSLGLCVGALLYLFGYEFLALVEWMSVTTTALIMNLHLLHFGDAEKAKPFFKWIVTLCVVISLCAMYLPIWIKQPTGDSQALDQVALNGLGQELIKHHYLEVFALVITSFVLIVGLTILGRQRGEAHD